MKQNNEIKKAATEIDLNPFALYRWSPRSFSDKSIQEEDLQAVFEAARWAPSCFNEQPWQFLVVKKSDKQNFEKIEQILYEKNRAWALQAPVLFLVLSAEEFKANGKKNRFSLYDAGQAVAHLTMEAWNRGIYVHQMAGFSRKDAIKLFSIPDNYNIGAMAAMGYPGDPGNLSLQEHRESETAERSRKPHSELFFKLS